MPLPASVIASIVSAVIDLTAQFPAQQAPQYDAYVRQQKLPPQAKVGYMQPPSSDGTVVIDETRLRLSAAIQIRSLQNLIVVPSSVREPTNVVYLNDLYGSVHRVWMITKAEADSLAPE